jgi:DNA-binding NtrC family response regulator
MLKKKPRILIVDDERDWAASVKGMLEENYTVDAVETGEEGVSKIRQEPYDLIIMDYQLVEDKSGTDFMTDIKQFNKIIPVILVSGKIDERKPVVEAIQKGVTNYLEKQVELPQKLPRAIKEALDGRDLVVMAMEEWVEKIEDPNQILISNFHGEQFSAKQIMEEIKKDSQNGRRLRQEIVKLVIQLIAKGVIKV